MRRQAMTALAPAAILALIAASAALAEGAASPLPPAMAEMLRSAGVCPEHGDCLAAPDLRQRAMEAAKRTEQWSPVPPKVAPGATVGASPGDAIVLFDGKAIDPDLLEEVAHTELLENRAGEVAVPREKR